THTAADKSTIGVAEWWRQLALPPLGARAEPDRPRPLLDGLDATHPDAHRRVELQRAPARGGLRVAEHDTDLLPDLVDEDHDGARARDGGRELAEGLRHQPGLQAGQRVAHVAVH